MRRIVPGPTWAEMRYGAGTNLQGGCPLAHARPKARSADLFDREELAQLQPSGVPPRRPALLVPPDLAAAEQQIAVIRRTAELLRAATISLTLPNDWVRMGDYGYLQNKGCERVTKAWGIQTERVERDDFTRDPLPGGHVGWSVIVSGYCERTGERKTEIGLRSTVSQFYRDRFEEAGETERTLLIYDCKKSALTNAHGRLTRALTGMSGLALTVLSANGVDVDKIPEAEFQNGGKGGRLNANEASDAQLWKIAALACKDRRVQGLASKDMDRTKEMLQRCRLTRGRQGTASAVIEWLQQQAQPVPMDEFLGRVGYVPPPDGPPPGSAPAASAGADS